MNNKFTISEAAKYIGASIDTLRRLDKKKILLSVRAGKTAHRYYFENDLANYIRKLSISNMTVKWVGSSMVYEPISDFYCRDSYVLQSRLMKLENDLSKSEQLKETYSLLVAITGEIANNSFDHNLGNWPDVPGIFFAWDLDKKMIALADRGRGILATLKSVKPELKNDKEALLTAFTEVITGRAPENRGNGLKFVRNVVFNNNIKLQFISGQAELRIKPNDRKLKIRSSKKAIRGCLAIIEF